MATVARKVAAPKPIPPSPLQRFNRTGARRLPSRLPVKVEEGVIDPRDIRAAQNALMNYAVARTNVEIGARAMEKEAARLKEMMERLGIKEITVDDLVAHFPRKMSKASRDITPQDAYTALGQDDDAFYECVTVGLGKLAKHLTEAEIAAIAKETAAALKDPEFAIEPIDKKTMT